MSVLSNRFYKDTTTDIGRLFQRANTEFENAPPSNADKQINLARVTGDGRLLPYRLFAEDLAPGDTEMVLTGECLELPILITRDPLDQMDCLVLHDIDNDEGPFAWWEESFHSGRRQRIVFEPAGNTFVADCEETTRAGNVVSVYQLAEELPIESTYQVSKQTMFTFINITLILLEVERFCRYQSPWSSRYTASN